MASPAHEIAQQPIQNDIVEQGKTGTEANASAGLNLNVFGAVSGLFSSKSDKQTDADGSSREETEERAQLKGVGMGNFNAQAAGSAKEHSRHSKNIS